jgi:hypothetical protein
LLSLGLCTCYKILYVFSRIIIRSSKMRSQYFPPALYIATPNYCFPPKITTRRYTRELVTNQIIGRCEWVLEALHDRNAQPQRLHSSRHVLRDKLNTNIRFFMFFAVGPCGLYESFINKTGSLSNLVWGRLGINRVQSPKCCH